MKEKENEMSKEEKKIAQMILSKLNKKEIGELCEAWDAGIFDEAMRNIILPVDVKNQPDLYVIDERMCKR